MKQLTMGEKIAYGSGSLSMNLANLVISQWLLKLYVPNKIDALVPIALFSVIFLFGRVVDGVLDPLVGYLSDTLRFKGGRRLPFIRAMVIPVSVACFLLWTPPVPDGMSWINGVYIFVIVQLFFIFWTILANPYMALLPEITTDLKERVTVSTIQAVFLMLGTLVFAFIGPIKDAIGWGGMGAFVGALVLVSYTPTIFFIKEKFQWKEAERKTGAGPRELISWAKTSLKNRPFVILLTTTTLYWFALNLLTLMIPFWIENVLGGTDSDVTLVMGPFLASNIIFFFVFNAFARRKGKFPAFIITLAGSAAGMFLFMFIGGERMMLMTQVVMAVIGIFVAGFMMLPYAILSDVIDYDETITGERREGMYFGIQSIFQKSSIGLSIALASWMMYIGGDNMPTELGLKLITATGGVFIVAALVVFLFYPLRERDGVAFMKK